MKLRDALEFALDGVRYVDELFLIQKENRVVGDGIYVRHRMRIKDDCFSHYALVEYINRENNTWISVPIQTYPRRKILPFYKLPGLNPREDGWELCRYSGGMTDLKTARYALDRVINMFEKETNNEKNSDCIQM